MRVAERKQVIVGSVASIEMIAVVELEANKMKCEDEDEIKLHNIIRKEAIQSEREEIFEILNIIEKEYTNEPKQNVVSHGLYTIHRIKNELKQRLGVENNEKRNTNISISIT